MRDARTGVRLKPGARIVPPRYSLSPPILNVTLVLVSSKLRRKGVCGVCYVVYVLRGVCGERNGRKTAEQSGVEGLQPMKEGLSREACCWSTPGGRRRRMARGGRGQRREQEACMDDDWGVSGLI